MQRSAPACVLSILLSASCAGAPATPDVAPAQTAAPDVHPSDALDRLERAVDGRLSAVRDGLARIAATSEARSGEFERIRPLLVGEQARHAAAFFFYAAPDGRYWRADAGLQDASIADRAYFRQASAGRASAGEVIVSRSAGVPAAVVAVPVLDAGRVTGVVAASVELRPLCELVRADVPLPDGAAFFALDRAGRTALHSEAQRILEEPLAVGTPSLRAAIGEMLAADEGAVRYEFGGEARTAVWRTSPLTGWKLAVRPASAR